MKTITLQDLHQKTEEWVRWATQHGQIVVTDQGTAIAAIQPLRPSVGHNPFANRRLVPAYEAIMNRLSGGTDSTEIVSEEREQTVP